MAKLESVFDPTKVPEREGGGDFTPLPVGWYDVTITEGDIKATKAGTGSYIKLRLDVEGPTHQGRVLFTNFNIRNPNPKAEEIGQQQLSEMCRAVGLARLTDTDELVGKRMTVKVTVKDDPQYGPGNEVKGYKARSGSPAPGGASAPAGGGSKPPWER